MAPSKQASRSKARRTNTLAIGLLLLVGLTGGATVVMADHSMDRDELDQHCPDHNGHPNKVDNPSGGSSHNITVNGTEIWLHFSEDLKSVNFTEDEAGLIPIDVEFCIKAADRAGGKETGDEGHVSWENRGGNTPEISYVIVYRILEDDNGNGNGEVPCPGPQDIRGSAEAGPPRNELDWDAFAGATGYNLYRSEEGGSFELIAQTDATTTEFTDFNVTVGNDYTYRVTAQLNGEESEHCDEITLTAIPVFPGLLAGVAAAAVGIGAYAVSRRRQS